MRRKEGEEERRRGEKERREGEGEKRLHQRASPEPTPLPPSSQPHRAAEAPTRKGLVSGTEV
jgi:hypothetical protein